ncbi:SET and MYND domain containing, arthropod-specific, member 5 [Haematobia irritans]|uniref:SET and MYND domain containing, arthropod-specific, member 5 n=1 Tax=Haematobia irritans TaxID=7368 RepID=UPI003F504199
MSASVNKKDCCAVCQVPATLTCSACKSVKYCGKDHQREHWKEHKVECESPYKIETDPILGRHLLVTRDIQAGNVIFEEAPLVVGPKWFLSEREQEVPVMPCVGCYTPCRIGGFSCSKCHWPCCSPHCEDIDNPNTHGGIECDILRLGPGPKASGDLKSMTDYYRPDALLVLKCLLLQKRNPKKWKKLMDMQSHEEERKGGDLHEDAEKRVVTYLVNNFLEPLKKLEEKTKEKLLPQFDATILRRICGIIETNYMVISLSTGLELSGVFFTACMMEHSCLPNSYFQFNECNEFSISVIAGRDIAAGEHIKIMYTNMLWATSMRHEHLQITKHFRCKCERCSDPTELGTYFSAMKCAGDANKKCDGVQLPKDPLDKNTDWICDKCPMIINGEQVSYLLTQMTEEVKTLMARRPTVKQVEALIEKLTTFLHPNHYHIFSLKHCLIQLYGNEMGYKSEQLSSGQLQKKLKMCEDLYDTCQKLDPSTIRLSIYVAIIFHEMHSVYMEQGRRILDNDKAKAMEAFTNAKEALEKAEDVLEKELDGVAGNKLNDHILRAMKNVKFYIENMCS